MPALLTGTVRLSIEEYRLAWAQAGLSTMHWNLVPPGTDEETFAQRAMIRAAAFDGLRAKGLAAESHITDDLADTLGLIARPLTEINARLLHDTGSIGLVASAQADLAVVAILHTDHLELSPIPAADFVSSVAERIAVGPAAPGRPVTVPADLLAAQDGVASADVERRLLDAGISRGDIATLRAHTTGPKLSGAKIGTARVDAGGNRHEGRFALTYLQTQHGGIAIHYRRDRDERLLCTVEPADPVGLARLLSAMAQQS